MTHNSKCKAFLKKTIAPTFNCKFIFYMQKIQNSTSFNASNLQKGFKKGEKKANNSFCKDLQHVFFRA